MGFANVVCFFFFFPSLPVPSRVTAHRINSDKMVINISPPLLKRREDAGASGARIQRRALPDWPSCQLFYLFFIYFFLGESVFFNQPNLVVLREKKLHFSVLSLSQLFMKDYRND